MRDRHACGAAARAAAAALAPAGAARALAAGAALAGALGLSACPGRDAPKPVSPTRPPPRAMAGDPLGADS
ncbi:MAG TPA: hypothetical protein VKB80_06460, partial [Kofleriaceae bacterium]|nr:hypothetical protein [Kofleriaceae bacterium]